MVSVNNKDVHARSSNINGSPTRASNKLNIYLLFTIDSTVVIRRFGASNSSHSTSCDIRGVEQKTNRKIIRVEKKQEEEDKRRRRTRTQSMKTNKQSEQCKARWAELKIGTTSLLLLRTDVEYMEMCALLQPISVVAALFVRCLLHCCSCCRCRLSSEFVFC